VPAFIYSIGLAEEVRGDEGGSLGLSGGVEALRIEAIVSDEVLFRHLD
jgi:hypothetical protein